MCLRDLYLAAVIGDDLKANLRSLQSLRTINYPILLYLF